METDAIEKINVAAKQLELYDLSVEVTEDTNVIKQYPKVAKMLEAKPEGKARELKTKK
jgi:hypothetical protein